VLNLSDLFHIIGEHWDVFGSVAKCPLDDFRYHARHVAELRKGESHSRDQKDYDALRPSFDFLEAVAEKID
jgi:hypothetical protein